MSQIQWDVYLNGKLVDSVFYDNDCDQEYVRRTLIEHDGYNCNIVVARINSSFSSKLIR